MWVALAIGYHVASRLAYVLGVGAALTQQKRHQIFTREAGVEAGFRRFQRLASIVMNNDALSFVFLCLLTRETLSIGLPTGVRVGAGALLILVGVGTKLWAAKALDAGAYYWRDVFEPPVSEVYTPRGPYRVLRNPMYTIGYLHAYGFALAAGSGWGLLAAAFDQAAILIFHYLVEKPHFKSLTSPPSGDRAPGAVNTP